jgi:hypothetical protein
MDYIKDYVIHEKMLYIMNKELISNEKNEYERIIFIEDISIKNNENNSLKIDDNTIFNEDINIDEINNENKVDENINENNKIEEKNKIEENKNINENNKIEEKNKIVENKNINENNKIEENKKNNENKIEEIIEKNQDLKMNNDELLKNIIMIILYGVICKQQIYKKNNDYEKKIIILLENFFQNNITQINDFSKNSQDYFKEGITRICLNDFYDFKNIRFLQVSPFLYDHSIDELKEIFQNSKNIFNIVPLLKVLF